jgi:hypothetical protein
MRGAASACLALILTADVFALVPGSNYHSFRAGDVQYI